MNANAIAAQFLDRTTSGEIWLTRKQAAWLYNTFCHEIGQRVTRYGTPTAFGQYGDKSWKLTIAHSGAGHLIIDTPISQPAPAADPRTAELMSLMLAGKLDEARALADAMRADTTR